MLKHPRKPDLRQKWFLNNFQGVDLSILTKDQKKVICNYFGIDCQPIPQIEIAKKYNFTVQKVANVKRFGLNIINNERYGKNRSKNGLISIKISAKEPITIQKVNRGLILRHKQNVVLELIPENHIFFLDNKYSYYQIKDTEFTPVNTSFLQNKNLVYEHQIIRVDTLNYIKSQTSAIAKIAKFLLLGKKEPILLTLTPSIIGQILALTRETVSRNLHQLVDFGAIAYTFNDGISILQESQLNFFG